MLKIKLLAVLAFALALAAPRAASAQSTPPGPAAGPAAHCVSWGAGRLDCFSRGRGGNFVHRWRNGESWSGWANLQGATGGIGSCTSWGESRLDCFVVGTDRGLWHRWYAGGLAWASAANPFTGGWEPLGGSLHSDPSCVSSASGRIDCFARGDGDVMVSRSWDGRNWGAWRTHGGLFLRGAPHCIVVNDGSTGAPVAQPIYCVAKGPDSGLWLTRLNAGDTRESRWEALGGVITSQPSCVARSVLDFHCFARGTDNALHHVWLQDLNRPIWESWGGILTSDPSCVSTNADRIDCFVRATDGSIFRVGSTKRKASAVESLSRDIVRRSPESRSEWESLGGNWSSAPSCFAERRWLDRAGTGRIDCLSLDGLQLSALSLIPTGAGRWQRLEGAVGPRPLAGRE